MKKATHATIKRLKGLNTYISNELCEFIQIAINVDALFADGFENFEASAMYVENGLLLKVKAETVKKYLRGLSTRFPDLIACTFTHRNNQCCISDINELSRRMVKD